MSAKELEDWLKTENSTELGWQKDDGSGETIGVAPKSKNLISVQDRLTYDAKF
jgi:hypothetical protein